MTLDSLPENNIPRLTSKCRGNENQDEKIQELLRKLKKLDKWDHSGSNCSHIWDKFGNGIIYADSICPLNAIKATMTSANCSMKELQTLCV